MGVIARVPLASGLLTGKFGARHALRRRRPPGLQPPRRELRRRRDLLGSGLRDRPQAVEELRPLVPEGATLAQLALRWILDFDAVSTDDPWSEDVGAGARECRSRRVAAAVPGDARCDRGRLSTAHRTAGAPRAGRRIIPPRRQFRKRSLSRRRPVRATYASVTSVVKASASPASASATTDPPKPPPVRRAASAP